MIRRTFSRVLSGLLVAATVSAIATPAAACGMYKSKERLSPADRIAKAERSLKGGNWDEAARFARGVAFDESQSATMRSKAFGIAAVARWKQGKKHAATLNFRKARELDPKNYDTVLASQSDESAIRAAVDEA